MRIHSTIIASLAALTLAASACATGPAVERYPPAMSAAGVGLRLRIGDTDLAGELLEVQDSAIVVLTPTEVALVHFRAIRGMRLPNERLPYRGGPPSTNVRERLRLLSRFPVGIPSGQLTRLLQARGQETIRAYQP